MKRLAITFCTASLLFACNSEDKKAADAKTDETKVAGVATKPEAWVPVDTATANKAWMAYMQPGKAHEMLAKRNGVWEGDMTMWMEDGGQPSTIKTTTDNKMILGGRYQISTNKGNFMGMPFEGIATTGFDNAKKVYVSSWVDNMGTGIMNMEGTWDEASKTISFKGKMICPANGKECDVREVYKIVDDNTQVMEMYGPDMKTGKEYKNMQVTYRRKK